jgi:multiple sugar transport system substrate-binding protein
VTAGLAVFASALTGCGFGTSGSTGKGKSITAVFLSGGAYDPCSDTYAKKFRDKTGIKVHVIHEGYPTLHDKLLTTLSSGAQSYDAIMTAYQWIGEFSPFLSPLTEQTKKDASLHGIIPSVMKTYVFDDKQYAVPFSAQSDALFYRTDLFKKAGLKPPASWDEFEKTATFFDKNPDFPGIHGTSVKGGDANVQSEFNNRYYGLGGKTLGAPGTRLDVGIATKALSLLKSDEAASPAGSRQATFAEVSAQFAQGKVAMAELQPTTVLSQITPRTPQNKVYGKVGVVSIPGGVGESGGWGMTIPKSSPNKDAAYRFVSFIASRHADHDCFVKYGKSPVQASTYKAGDVSRLFYADGIRSALEASLPRPSGVTAGKINNMFTDICSRFTAGQISSAHDAARMMADQYDKLVDEK